MTVTSVFDVLSLVCLFAGSLLCLAASIGLLRFPDLISRMHAATKPQTLGVLIVLLGVGLGLRSGLDVGMLLLVGLFQLMTAPISSHMMSRAAVRTGQAVVPVPDSPADFEEPVNPAKGDGEQRSS